MFLDFKDWNEDNSATDGSGRSEKIWIINKQGYKGLFKYPKSEFTTEHISESIASDICSVLEIKSSKIDLGIYDGRQGSLSYLINNTDTENICEGLRYITKLYPNYDENKLEDSITKEKYSLEMIWETLEFFKKTHFKKDIIEMMVLDFIIGNSDRHHSNWAILSDFKNNMEVFCPLYDNGSSLCAYENKTYENLKNDKVKLNAICNTKSTSIIRIYKTDDKRPTHYNMMKHIVENYFEYAEEVIHRIFNNLDDYKIDEIVNNYNDILDEHKSGLIKIFIKEKKKLLQEILSRKERKNMKKKQVENLKVVWKETVKGTRRNYVIGELTKDETLTVPEFTFKYGYDVDKAIDEGFKLIIPFDNRDEIYKNNRLFPSFSSRVPDPKRKDIARILNKYNLVEYDAFEILKASTGRLPIDNLSFEKSIEEYNEFYLQGCRHYLECKGEPENCPSIKVCVGDKLELKKEPQNKYDENAIKVIKNGECIGYIPRYYAEDIAEMLNEKNYELKVIEYNHEKNCQECIKVLLKFVDKD